MAGTNAPRAFTVAVLVLIAVILLGFIVIAYSSFLSGRAPASGPSGTVPPAPASPASPARTYDDSLTVYFDQTFDFDDIRDIYLSAGVTEMTVYPSEDGKLRVVQTGRNISERYLITVTKSGSGFDIVPALENQGGMQFGSTPWDMKNYVDVYLPATFTGKLKARTSAGSMCIEGAYTVDDLELRVSAGDLVCNGILTAKEADLHTSAGSLEVKTLNAETFEADTSAGSIEIGSLSGSGKLSSSAGDIDVDSLTIDDSLTLKTSAGSISVGIAGDPDIELNGKLSAGSIRTYFSSGSDIVKGRISVTTGDGPYKKIEANTSAGDIHIRKA
ncbi:DUF4097 domain-containing protein [Ruminococcaceae bacterium OttesenSCG-928-L11]|nr:DUF4097 domain-containing protein [Ruminococcaceae bacterium OttesenSCG-928-L11]